MSERPVEEQIEYGLDAISAERTVEVPLRDMMYVFQTLGVLINFFHQDSHYPDVEAVHRFLGNRENGAFAALCECYYDRLRDILPEDIALLLDEGKFDNPAPPYYYQAEESAAG